MEFEKRLIAGTKRYYESKLEKWKKGTSESSTEQVLIEQEPYSWNRNRPDDQEI